MTAPATPARARPGVAGPGAGGRGWLGLARAAAAPAACALVLIGLLSAWVAGGGAGTLNRVRIQVSRATVPMSRFAGASPGSHAPGRSGAYLTIRNLSGTADVLTGASTPAARGVLVMARPGAPAGHGLAIAAHGTLALSPFGSDLVLTGTHGLVTGAQVPLTLTFRRAGRVTVQARVTPPGAP